MINRLHIIALFVFVSSVMFIPTSCKHKKQIQKTADATPIINDTLNNRCRLDYKTAKTLIKHVKENEFNYKWLYAKANVESNVDNEENSFDVRLRCRKDSAILITIEKLSIDIAKILITRDSVKMRIDVKRQYFKGDFNYINQVLNADLDFDVLQAVMFGNSAEFYDDDETRLKPVTDRANCHYLLSTERKRKLKRIQQGEQELKKALQILTLVPNEYKIIKNEFIDPQTNRTFTANYKDFKQKDSVYAPYLVDIDIVAEKKAKLKIEYVRIEKNTPQKISLSIPKSYDLIAIPEKQK
jgi:hypothetical protein